MDIRFLGKKRKGVTPIIAIVLLLMMTVAAGGMAWTFIQSTMEQQQQSAEKELDKMTQAQLRILEGNGTAPLGAASAGTELTLFIKNPGVAMSMPNTGAIVKINGDIDKGMTADSENALVGTCVEKEIEAGRTCELTLDFTKSLDTNLVFPDVGDTMDVEIQFKTGQTVMYSCTARGAGQTTC